MDNGLEWHVKRTIGGVDCEWWARVGGVWVASIAMRLVDGTFFWNNAERAYKIPGPTTLETVKETVVASLHNPPTPLGYEPAVVGCGNAVWADETDDALLRDAA